MNHCGPLGYRTPLSCHIHIIRKCRLSPFFIVSLFPLLLGAEIFLFQSLFFVVYLSSVFLHSRTSLAPLYLNLLIPFMLFPVNFIYFPPSTVFCHYFPFFLLHHLIISLMYSSTPNLFSYTFSFSLTCSFFFCPSAFSNSPFSFFFLVLLPPSLPISSPFTLIIFSFFHFLFHSCSILIILLLFLLLFSFECFDSHSGASILPLSSFFPVSPFPSSLVPFLFLIHMLFIFIPSLSTLSHFLTAIYLLFQLLSFCLLFFFSYYFFFTPN